MDYMTTKDASTLWGISDRRIQQLCNSNRVKGAVKMGNTWLIPKSAQKPADGRYRENRKNIATDSSDRIGDNQNG